MKKYRQIKCCQENALNVLALQKSLAYARDQLSQLELDYAVLVAQSEADRITFYEREVALAEARDAAQRANDAKNVFLSNMSHELRTPLNAIIGFAQVLSNSRRTPLTEQQRGYVNQIYKAGQHLLVLINEVLDLAAIEADKMHLNIESMSLPKIVADAVELVRPQLAKSSLHFINCLEADAFSEALIPYIEADAVRARQALLNLLTNAIKYNRPTGEIELSLEVLPEYVRVLVRDTGYGIDPSRKHELFRPFSRLDYTHSAIEGTGIGLMLTRRLMEHMGGSISFESEVGVGSTFCLEFVRAPSSFEGDASNLDHVPFLYEIFDAIPAQVKPKVCEVLYVEDRPMNVQFIEALLAEQPNFKLHSVSSGEAALEYVQHVKPDIFLIDLCLQGMSGETLARRLASMPELANIPRLSVSSSLLDFQSEFFLEHFNKPVDGSRLLRSLTRLFLDSSEVTK